mmetsp:Transcript_538/g.1044  ORF Transcript_538/g.1044 Transcript_538/m.1044 type:complete len:502 (+) Transcript_538:1007-2512(+)
MGIVLAEAPDAREAGEGARDLVSVEDAEVAEADGELLVGAQLLAEHEAVGGAVHGLHAEAVVLDLHEEDVVLVVEVVARGLPQLEVEQVGRLHLLVAAHAVLLADHVHQLVVDEGALGEHEGAAGREGVHVEEVLVRADVPVVALGGLLHEVDVLVHLLLGGEGDAVDALQTVVARLAQPVGARVLHHAEGLDHLGGRDVGPRAQVDQAAAAVGGHAPLVGDLALDQRDLEGVGAEEAQGVLLGEHEATEGLALGHDLLGALLNGLVVRLVEDVVAAVRVVEEAGLGGGTVAELHAVLVLQGLSEHVRRRVPEGLLALLRVELEEQQLTVTLQLPLHVPEEPLVLEVGVALGLGVEQALVEGGHSARVLDLGDDDFVRHLLGDLGGDVVGRGLETGAGHHFSVGQRHLDLLSGEVLVHIRLLSEEVVPNLEALGEECGFLLELPLAADAHTLLVLGVALGDGLGPAAVALALLVLAGVGFADIALASADVEVVHGDRFGQI